ncbi:HMG1/2-like protein isoform X1 [Juglans microcarpa x Juglans regia]|uniref:HMG1/2-like protein isoform X1 n=1 Tax=Juglans microcarpa x Juglans regia TaxID=2249226 RepID=UPI001B7F0013|nr:HMG1/2-like protein isoform X1 [Juglans microcarpa x Juglans regia]
MKVAKVKASTRKDKLEVSKPVEERKVGKRKAAVKADNSRLKWAKKTKLDKKDPNKPKRPATAFFVFLEEFRKTYKEEHPNEKAVSVVGKAGGGKWKSMSAAEKSPYEVKAAQKKSDYEKLMIAYNKKQVNSQNLHQMMKMMRKVGRKKMRTTRTTRTMMTESGMPCNLIM